MKEGFCLCKQSARRHFGFKKKEVNKLLLWTFSTLEMSSGVKPGWIFPFLFLCLVSNTITNPNQTTYIVIDNQKIQSN